MLLPTSSSPASRASIPSFRSASRKAGLSLTRAMTVSLNGRVRGILDLAFLAILVVLPAILRSLDVPLLTLLRSTAKQYDDFAPVLAKVHAVARPEIHLQLECARADTFRIRSVAHTQASQCNGDFGGGGGIQPIEPSCEWATPAIIMVLSQLHIVPYMLPIKPNMRRAEPTWDGRTPQPNRYTARPLPVRICLVRSCGKPAGKARKGSSKSQCG